MKLFTMFCILFTFIGVAMVTAQQPQGEFHKHIIKKTDHERRKTKGQEWWGAGAVVFSKEEIPRLGKTAEVQPLLQTQFNHGDTFFGRVYSPVHMGGLPGGMPEVIEYRVIENGKRIYEIESRGDALPESDWSSWLMELPSDLQRCFDELPEGTHNLRIEVWSARTVEVLTEWKDRETDKTVGFTKENEGRIKFIAAGDIVYVK
ncbi:hypothetical protein L6Q79_10505 [bacterium]|nr:hypothetical protein [bacterium]